MNVFLKVSSKFQTLFKSVTWILLTTWLILPYGHSLNIMDIQWHRGMHCKIASKLAEKQMTSELEKVPQTILKLQQALTRKLKRSLTMIANCYMSNKIIRTETRFKSREHLRPEYPRYCTTLISLYFWKTRMRWFVDFWVRLKLKWSSTWEWCNIWM